MSRRKHPDGAYGAGPLFDRPAADPVPIPPHWTDEEQIEQARRVGGAIGADVQRFAAERLAANEPEFRMEELRRFIGSGRAPDSPGRILRLLRQAGLLDYAVLNRAQSLYTLDPQDSASPPPEGQA